MSRSRRVLLRLEIGRAAPPPKVRMYLESEAAPTPELLLCGSALSGLRVKWMNRMADPGGIDKAFAPRAGTRNSRALAAARGKSFWRAWRPELTDSRRSNLPIAAAPRLK